MRPGVPLLFTEGGDDNDGVTLPCPRCQTRVAARRIVTDDSDGKPIEVYAGRCCVGEFFCTIAMAAV